jgi:hypothetical protein
MSMKSGLVLAGLITVLGSSSPVSPFNHIKTGRERMQEIFVLGDLNRADWYLTLAEKRLAEASKLNSAGWTKLAGIQMQIACKNYRKGQTYLQRLEGTTDINYLLQKSGEIAPRLIY